MTDKKDRQSCCHVSKLGNPCQRPARSENHGYCTKCFKLKGVQKKLGLESGPTKPVNKPPPLPPRDPPPPEETVKAPGFLWDEVDNEESKGDLDEAMNKILSAEESEEPKKKKSKAPPPEEIELGTVEDEDLGSVEEDEREHKYSFSSRALLTMGLGAVAQMAEYKVAHLYGLSDDIVANDAIIDSLCELTDNNMLGRLEEMDPLQRAGVLIAMVCVERASINMMSGLTQEELKARVDEKIKQRFAGRTTQPGQRIQPQYD